ncbi:HNH endonuclease signature motif containing protein [Tomitella biformata]|uniref:HNH endonuclease signature motif containing protein n=1 Tax=Tomitella biformata TaxID=630403 RepID=UPI000465676B|nr:HNH endonuclease signature motif containing protein [Tomitella biformata]
MAAAKAKAAEIAELGDELCSLAGHIAAATAKFLALLAEFDAKAGWAGAGIVSCAHWLSWKCGLDLRTAREHVRVAKALTTLPKTEAKFAGGRLSYSKVRAITRVAKPETEGDLVEIALEAPASQVDKLIQGLLASPDPDSDPSVVVPPDPSRLRMSHRWDEDTGDLVITGRFTPEDGAVILAALTRAEFERLRKDDGEPDLTGPPPSNVGPAMVVMAQTMAAVVEAPAGAPAAEIGFIVEKGAARVEGGPGLGKQAASEVQCGGIGRRITKGRGGGPILGYGRRRRMPSQAQLDVLHLRDGCCQTPGCGHTRFLHAHHVRFWERGGRTDMDNLILLCGSCHRALHHGEFTIKALGQQQFQFRNKVGAVVERAPGIAGDPAKVFDGSVDRDAIIPGWRGDVMDMGYATSVLIDSWEYQKRARKAAEEETKGGAPEEDPTRPSDEAT